MERISIYIDGGNFYHLVVKKLGIEETEFDFDAFANLLVDGRVVGENCKRFYKGSIREKEGDLRSKELMSKQTRLFTFLQKGGWDIKTSKLRTRMEELVIDSRVVEYQKLKKLGIEKIHTERMREKGIDVKIATDLLVGAFDDKYDTAIVVSSDSDLVPAIDWIRNRMKKKVEYIGFSIPDEEKPENSTRPLTMMFSKTDVQRVFSDIDMKKLIKLGESNLFSENKMTEIIPEFGIKRENEERRDGGCGIVFDQKTQRYAVGKHSDGGFLRLFSGGVDENEDIKEGILREVTEESGLYDFLYVKKIAEAMTHYHNSLKNVNRVGKATCFLIILKSIDLKETHLEEHEKFTLVWATMEEILSNWQDSNQNKDCDHWFYFMKKAVSRAIELGYDKSSHIS